MHFIKGDLVKTQYGNYNPVRWIYGQFEKYTSKTKKFGIIFTVGNKSKREYYIKRKIDRIIRIEKRNKWKVKNSLVG